MDILVPRGKSARIVPVRFVRAPGAGEIDAERPEVDNRGYRAPQFGAVVGVAEGHTIRVAVERVGVPTDVSLHAVVAEGSAEIFELAAGASLGSERVSTVTLRGKAQVVEGGRARADARLGVLEVRAESASGPVVGKLHVEVFAVRRIDLTLHRVTHFPLHGAVHHGTADPPAYDRSLEYRCTLDMAAIAAVAAAVWIPYGVELVAQPWQSWEARAAEDLRGLVRDTYGDDTAERLGAADDYPEWVEGTQPRQITGLPEIRRALSVNRVPHTVNVYFVRALLAAYSDGGPLVNFGGLGLRRERARQLRAQPGIFVCEDWGNGFLPMDEGSGLQVLGRALAHELGHFLDLAHVGRREPASRHPRTHAIVGQGADASWHALLNLMHPASPTTAAAEWSWGGSQLEYQTRPRADDRGYGDRNCGQHLTQKAVPNVPNDDQAHVARRYLRRPQGPY